MKIFLVKDVPGIGQQGSIVNVKDGHARNFLIPRGLAKATNDEIERSALKAQSRV